MIRKLLIANRGEIALRIVRSCRELGIATVAVHSEADEGALHVRFADEAVCIGPADAAKSYLHIPAILAAAEITNADAVHPGYGFLAERADFAAICAKAGLTFVGPSPEQLSLWGDKVRAREHAEALGLPVIKGSGQLADAAHAAATAAELGYPVMLKAAGGGGGRGMKIIADRAEMLRAFDGARAEALAAFGAGALYIERYVERPRHIEFQILCTQEGRCYVLGERECSIQRRHQKILEEAPSVALSSAQRESMSQTIEAAMSGSGYASLGTLEFLLDEKGELYFMEMNPRVQVEHPVTEMVTGLDLVAEQLRVAAGEAPHIPDGPIEPRGHAIECRINAEHPRTFAPSPGLIREYHPPGGHGIRYDDGVFGGWRVPPHYDSLLAKVIAHGATREQAVARMRRALRELIITGIETNIALQQRILAHPDFQAAKLSTAFVERIGLA